jgi:virginiamycin A acetyltransferase
MPKQAGDISVSVSDHRGVQEALRIRGLGFHNRHVPTSATAEAPCSISPATIYGNFEVGVYSFSGIGCEFRETTIGRFCLIARRVIVGSVDHPLDGISTHPIAWGSGNVFRGDPWFASVQAKRRTPWRNGRVTIGNDVWVGNGVFVRRGVTIGHGAVIAAGSVVIHDVAPYDIVGGVPARRIRPRFSADIISRLLAVRWWDLDLKNKGVDLSNMDSALPALEDLRAAAVDDKIFARWSIKIDKTNNTLNIKKDL